MQNNKIKKKIIKKLRIKIRLPKEVLSKKDESSISCF
jgi:hypothetical protein